MPMHAQQMWQGNLGGGAAYFVTANPSICPFVCHTLVLYWNECTYCQTLSTVW